MHLGASAAVANVPRVGADLRFREGVKLGEVPLLGCIES